MSLIYKSVENSVTCNSYSSVINMSTALVAMYDDMAIVHEPELDRLRMLSASIVKLLSYIDRKKVAEFEVLQLISDCCLSLSSCEPKEGDSRAYLQHLIDQGIIKKTQ